MGIEQRGVWRFLGNVGLLWQSVTFEPSMATSGPMPVLQFSPTLIPQGWSIGVEGASYLIAPLVSRRPGAARGDWACELRAGSRRSRGASGRRAATWTSFRRSCTRMPRSAAVFTEYLRLTCVLGALLALTHVRRLEALDTAGGNLCYGIY